ncbi:MAG: DNA alkylation repair protein [Anaerolineaceae bacterium]
MPAVELAHLRTKIHLLTEHYASPVEFVKGLCDLYEFYSDRTFTQSDAGRRTLTLPGYNVTPLINRQFELEFGKLCQDNPLSSLDVIDELWKQPKLEPRRLAAFLLGKIPLDHSDQVIVRLKVWSTPEEDNDLLKYLHDYGSLLLRRQDSEKWLGVIRTWLESKSSQDQLFGLQSLLPLINDPDYVDLPEVFDLISLELVSPQPRITHTLQTVIEALAKRTPFETVYLLKKVLLQSHSKELPRLLRRLIPAFPDNQQSSLKRSLAEDQKSL